MNKILKLLGCLFLPIMVGGISGYATSENIESWHQFLIKPSFNPPNYLFGPVWTLLYILMGISLFLIVNMPKSINRNKAIGIFFLQLILNFFWSIIFFSYHQIGWAFVEIIILWISIIWMIFTFYPINKKAALINIPYLLWVSFASVLNFAIWQLNK